MSTDTGGTARDAQHVPLSKADRLRQDAEAATELRRLSEHPDVVALQAERVRRFVDVLVWIGIGLGLAFTMVNVQTFAAEGAPAWSLPWLAAWLLDPMVSLVLIAVLRAEQITARYQVETGRWVNRTKWFAFAATYVMNTWVSWAKVDPAGIVLHSVPPILVFLASEAAPVLRDRLTASVHQAAESAREHAAPAEPVNTEPAPAASVHDQPTTPLPVTVRTVQQPARPRRTRKTAKPASGRKLRADYVAEARAAWSPEVEVTPAWVRSVTDCSRGLSTQIAAELRAQTGTGQQGRDAA